MGDTSRKTPSGPVLPPGSTPDSLAGTAMLLDDGTVVEASGPPPVAIPESDPLLGQVLDGRYRVVARIGQGGMGVVYEVEHVSLGRRMAVKVLASGLQMDEIDAKRFRREAEVTARITAPHIVAVTDCGKTPDGRHYFVMEFLSGADLATLLEQRSDPFDSGWVVRIAVQVCRALQAVHEARVVHRDIKPENLFLTSGPDGEPDFVKVVDFGIARVEDSEMRLTRLTRADSTVGTVGYMSPEQARAVVDLDGRTDIYSLAAVLYELLTRQLPIPGQGISEVLSRKQVEDPQSMRTIRPDVSEALDRVVLKALSRDRDLRYATMTEFAQALQDAMSVPSVDEVTPSLPHPTSHLRVVTPVATHARAHTSRKALRAVKTKRNRKIAIAGIALTLIMILAAIVSSLSSDDPEEVQVVPSPTVIPVQIYVPAPVQVPEVVPTAQVVETVTPTPTPDAGVSPRKAQKTESKPRPKASMRRPAKAPPPSSLSGAPVQGKSSSR